MRMVQPSARQSLMHAPSNVSCHAFATVAPTKMKSQRDDEEHNRIALGGFDRTSVFALNREPAGSNRGADVASPFHLHRNIGTRSRVLMAMPARGVIEQGFVRHRCSPQVIY